MIPFAVAAVFIFAAEAFLTRRKSREPKPLSPRACKTLGVLFAISIAIGAVVNIWEFFNRPSSSYYRDEYIDDYPDDVWTGRAR